MTTSRPELRKRRLAWVAALAALLTAGLQSISWDRLEAELYDARIRYASRPQAASDLILVAVDDASSADLGELPPLSLSSHARLLEFLVKAHPKSVGLLTDLSRSHEVTDPTLRLSEAKRLVQAARTMKNQGSRFLLGTSYDVVGEVLPPWPLSDLPHALAVIHRDGNVFAEDKVTRRAWVSFEGRPSFHSILALGIQESAASIPFPTQGSYTLDDPGSRLVFFRYPQGFSSEKIPYPVVRASQVLEGKVSPEIFRDRTVLIGSWIRQDAGDFTSTPLSRQAFTQPKLAVHGAIWDALNRNDGVIRAQPWQNATLTFLAIFLVCAGVLVTSPLRGLAFAATVIFTILGLGFISFSWSSFWIRLSHPLLGALLAFYLAVPYRLIREFRSRWEYQRKAELLQQVEELKRHFLSLVTHDLKTPVARIQGLTEQLLRRIENPRAHLPNEDEREPLQGILRSTDDLNRFITSILELSRLESEAPKLRLESRDLNRLIEGLTQDFLPQAERRGIQLEADLEPLFPIQMDPRLMAMVISNLIDNALKYSPDGGQVVIQTREAGKNVQISVKDNGIGLTEAEASQVFSRFYRGSDPRVLEVPGTGLGLYLSRYFVEAHQGQLSVRSHPGKGSTFQIELPQELSNSGGTHV